MVEMKRVSNAGIGRGKQLESRRTGISTWVRKRVLTLNRYAHSVERSISTSPPAACTKLTMTPLMGGAGCPGRAGGITAAAARRAYPSTDRGRSKLMTRGVQGMSGGFGLTSKHTRKRGPEPGFDMRHC